MVLSCIEDWKNTMILEIDKFYENLYNPRNLESYEPYMANTFSYIWGMICLIYRKMHSPYIDNDFFPCIHYMLVKYDKYLTKKIDYFKYFLHIIFFIYLIIEI